MDKAKKKKKKCKTLKEIVEFSKTFFFSIKHGHNYNSSDYENKPDYVLYKD